MQQGPLVWENWNAQLRGEPSREAWEFALYTDAHPTGEVVTALGPYQLLLGLSFRKGASDPAIVLRMEHHLAPPEPNLVWQATPLHVELAALVSLAFGIRCRSGGETRWFRPGEDLRGRPAMFAHRRPYLPPPVEDQRPILPNVVREVHLPDGVELLAILPQLSAKQADALVRAARAYAEAVWVVESDPGYSWLKLVSATEAAAGAWGGGDAAPYELLAEYEPELTGLLDETAGHDLVEAVAAHLAGRYRARRKFVRFLLAYGPGPPADRPPEPFQLEWPTLAGSLGKIYDVRSDALHYAIPVPQPMLNAPMQLGERAIMEVWPLDARRWVLLHTFERIVAEALRRWWRSLAPDAPE